MCKMTRLTMIRVEMSLKEAEGIIVDPTPFVVQLQDMLPAAPLDNSPQAEGARKNRGGWKLPKRHCDTCNRDIAKARWDKHQALHSDQAK